VGVKYILTQFGAKVGLNPNASTSRTIMLRFLNEAADELYNQSDMPGSLYEQVFKVNGDQTISVPMYVGFVRGARELDSQVAWSINQMRPRYNQFNWIDMWRNLRLKNRQALQATVTNQSVGVITVPVIDTPPITVSLQGPTAVAQSVTEVVTITSLSTQTQNQFLDYTVVHKSTLTQYDVTLSDIDGKVLTVIPSNEYSALYQIIDVSQCPWLAISTSTLDHYLEILYKKALPQLSQDADEFPAPGFDNVIVNKMLQLWFEEQGKPEIAMGYDTKATRSLARKSEEQNRATEDVVALIANPHDVLLPRIRQGRRKYYRGYGSRGYGY
jgi:hypothetical protein